jgi:hypothetical protein
MLLSSTQKLLDNALNGGKEGFINNSTYNIIAMVIVIIIWLLLLLFVSKYLWNQVLVKLVTVVKPATSVLQLIGLFILLEIMVPK